MPLASDLVYRTHFDCYAHSVHQSLDLIRGSSQTEIKRRILPAVLMDMGRNSSIQSRSINADYDELVFFISFQEFDLTLRQSIKRFDEIAMKFKNEKCFLLNKE